MSYELDDYKGLQVVTPDPAGDGGKAINDNFKTLADNDETLSADVAAKVPNTRTLTGTSPIQIDGSNSAQGLSANRTISIVAASSSQDGYYPSTHFSLVSGATNANTNSAIVRRDGSGGFSAGAVVLASGLIQSTVTSSGIDVLAIAPTWSGTVSGTCNDLSINSSESSFTGTHNLFIAKVGGTSKFLLQSDGRITSTVTNTTSNTVIFKIECNGLSPMYLKRFGDNNTAMYLSDKIFCQVSGNTFIFAHDSSSVSQFRGTAEVFQRVTSGVVPLSQVGGTINTNAALGNTFTVTLGGDRTMAEPANPANGQRIIYRIKQDGTGTRKITWNSVFRFSGGTAPLLTETLNKTDYIGFIYNGDDSKWDGFFLGANY